MDAIPRRARTHAAALARGLLLLSLLVAPARPAHAHAFPDHSDPRVGATVDRAPSQVRIWFDGELEPTFSTARVETEDRRRVDAGDARVDPQNGRLLEVSVPPLAPGRYRVYWSVIARDGHRTEGDFRFRVK